MPDEKQFDEVPEAHRVKKLWIDGEMTDADAVSLPVMTLTLHYGLGCFEGIRAYDGARGPAVFRLREHIQRLFFSANLLRMEIPYSEDELVEACLQTLAVNGLRAGYIRPIAFVDDGKRGLAAMNNRIRVAIVVWPWGAYLGEEGLRNGIRCCVSSWARMSPKSFLPKGKICGQYVNSILAKRDAVLAGYDEAILLDDEGFVTEASGENVFLADSGRLITAPRSSNILAGITRDSIIALAEHLGIQVDEARYPRSWLYGAEEVFLTGTAAEVTPVREVDDRTIGAGARGPVTERLQSLYFDVVRGKVEGFESWLSPYEPA
jgi:branched-chain amino acid aminotransferase